MQVKINGIDTRYVLSNEGGGPWLTFIHQLAGDLSVWDQLAGYFRDDYTVLRYDVRGHGQTAVSAARVQHRRPVARPRRRCSMHSAHPARTGRLSMGGMIAQQFAVGSSRARRHLDDGRQQRRPSRRGSPRHLGISARRPSAARDCASLVPSDARTLADGRLSPCASGGRRADRGNVLTPHVGGRLYASVRSPARFRRAQQAGEQSRCPTLVVAGSHDTGTPPAATQVIADAVDGARFEMLDAAHLAPIEAFSPFCCTA